MWLALQQSEDGSFTAGGAPPDPAGDALALLAFLGAGNRPLSGRYAETVARSIPLLSSRAFRLGGGGRELTPADPLTVLALGDAEILDMRRGRPRPIGLETGTSRLVARLRSPDRLDPDIAFWSSMSLLSARHSGVEQPEGILHATVRRVAWIAPEDRDIWSDERHASAAALLHLLLGADPSDGRMTTATERILAAAESGNVDDTLLYLGSYALFQVGGEPWNTWRARTNDALFAGQRANGSWAPTDGRSAVATTALRSLSLTVALRSARITGGR